MNSDAIDDNRPWRLVYRVSWWRANRELPASEVVGTLRDAKALAKKIAGYSAQGPAGRVLRIELAERIVTEWAVIEHRDLTTPTPPDPVGGESQQEDLHHDHDHLRAVAD